jgi:hypothetical protein
MEMPVTRRRLAAYVAGVAALVALLIGASKLDWSNNHDEASEVITRVPGIPALGMSRQELWKAFPLSHDGATWGPAGQIYVMLLGGSNCPSIVTSIDADGEHEVVVTTGDEGPLNGDDVCTGELGFMTSVVRLPDEIDDAGSLTVKIDDYTVRLPARSH